MKEGYRPAAAKKETKRQRGGEYPETANGQRGGA